jgi:hypothetical protein
VAIIVRRLRCVTAAVVLAADLIVWPRWPGGSVPFFAVNSERASGKVLFAVNSSAAEEDGAVNREASRMEIEAAGG